MPVSDIFLSATEMRNNPAFFIPIHTEARSIEDSILTAASAGFLDTVVFGTLMTDTTLAAWQVFSSVQVSPTNTITRTAHGFSTTDQVQFTTSGTLPTPLNASAVYYVIKVTNDTFSLAASRNDALNNIAIPLTLTGTGSVRGVSISQQYYNVWQGHSVDRVKSAQMTSVMHHFTSLGYTIAQQTNPTTGYSLQWVVSW